jgi:voltage-gated potassium channel
LVNSARWQRLTEWPLTVAALLFLGFYAWLVIADLQGPEDQLAQAVITATWALFAVDYFVRLVLAERRLHWFGRHLLDLAMVALPILRPLRLIRLLTLLAIFQRVAGRTLRGRVVVYTIISTFLLVFVSALAMLDAERRAPVASITTFGAALWWACTTITTVGYGDLYPVSFTGRCIAVALMVGGIALLGTITATIASWLVERVSERDEASQAATRQQVKELSQQVQRMQDLLLAGEQAEQIRSLNRRTTVTRGATGPTVLSSAPLRPDGRLRGYTRRRGRNPYVSSNLPPRR